MSTYIPIDTSVAPTMVRRKIRKAGTDWAQIIVKTNHNLRERTAQYGSAYGLLDTPESAAKALRNIFATDPEFEPEKENLLVLVVNTRRRMVCWNRVAVGTLDSVTVSAREIFRPVIAAAGSGLIMAHNHPSGDPQPSEADIRVTLNMIKAGAALQIGLLDSLIIGQSTPERPRDYCSLRELGYFYT